MRQAMKNLLVVDDNTDLLKMIDLALADIANITTATSIGQAKLMLNCCEIDLIVLDVMLPDGNGFDLCKDLKTNSFLKTIPVIMLTAKTSITDKIKGFSLGCNDYITKPFDLREVKARIEAKLKEVVNTVS
jgi:DNA-binding response OmpR family regulator